jgi:2-amino-4-hydroxy-6-hydroxymethyldihydropteridine diphosphokinase
LDRPWVPAWIALGANLGDAQATVLQALAALGQAPGIRLLASSSLYCTAPVDAAGPDYINAVSHISTCLPAPDLLTVLQNLEQAAGRERSYRNAPRTLDLDLLLYGDATVPHPRMAERAFVLVPLAEVSPERVPAAQLKAVQDQRIVKL